MTIIEAIILSIVEGLTEFIPVSSTGHLVLAADFLGIAQTDFVKSFEIAIQLGAILAVMSLYWRKLLFDKKVFVRLAAAFVPTAILGFILYTFIKQALLGNTLLTLAALFAGGLVLIAIELLYKEKDHDTEDIGSLSVAKAFLIGLAQSVSMVPGVSRAGATIIGGLLLGLKRKVAVEFSFLLAVPTMVAATGLDLFKTSFQFSSDAYTLLAIGFIGAFVTALLAVKYLLQYISNHTFLAFGVYRILLALLFWFFVVL